MWTRGLKVSCRPCAVGLTSPRLNFVLLQLVDLNLTQTDALQLIEALTHKALLLALP
uniref:Uncharacterized protein n=1 Tax=Takifugu rubripes TaxID=31033 RepID=A0A674P320_TAKRU